MIITISTLELTKLKENCRMFDGNAKKFYCRTFKLKICEYSVLEEVSIKLTANKIFFLRAFFIFSKKKGILQKRKNISLSSDRMQEENVSKKSKEIQRKALHCCCIVILVSLFRSEKPSLKKTSAKKACALQNNWVPSDVCPLEALRNYFAALQNFSSNYSTEVN